MADIRKKDTSGYNLGDGILKPAMQHQFRVCFPAFLAEDENGEEIDVIGRQVLSCKFDFRNKEVSVDIEMPNTVPVVQYLIHRLVARPNILTVEVLDGQGGIHQTLTVHLLKCINHALEFDYARTGAMYHRLTFQYYTIDVSGFTLK